MEKSFQVSSTHFKWDKDGVRQVLSPICIQIVPYLHWFASCWAHSNDSSKNSLHCQELHFHGEDDHKLNHPIRAHLIFGQSDKAMLTFFLDELKSPTLHQVTKQIKCQDGPERCGSVHPLLVLDLDWRLYCMTCARVKISAMVWPRQNYVHVLHSCQPISIDIIWSFISRKLGFPSGVWSVWFPEKKKPGVTRQEIPAK